MAYLWLLSYLHITKIEKLDFQKDDLSYKWLIVFNNIR